MDTASTASEADFHKLVQGLPIDIINLILEEMFGPSPLGGRPFEADRLGLARACNNYFDDDGDLTDHEHERSRNISDILLFRAQWPEDFACHAWLSPGLKLGCTVRISSDNGLRGFEERLSGVTGAGSYVGILVFNVQNEWPVQDINFQTGYLKIVESILAQLPHVQALYLRDYSAESTLLSEKLFKLLPSLKILCLDTYTPIKLRLRSLPTSLTCLRLHGIKVCADQNDAVCPFPQLKHLSLGHVTPAPAVLALAASAPLRALYLNIFGRKVAPALLQAVGPQLSELHVNRAIGTAGELPAGLLEGLQVLKIIVVGHCDADLLSSIPKSVQSFTWLAEMEKNLKPAAAIFEAFSKASTLPSLEAVPFIGIKRSSSKSRFSYVPFFDRHYVDHVEISKAARIAFKHFRDERRLPEARYDPQYSSYRPLLVLEPDSLD